MTTIVYPYHNKTSWDELRYSLRSMQQLKDNIQVCIVGEKPDWCQPDIFIPAENVGVTKDACIMNKILLACDHPDVSPEFVMANDDHYLLRPIAVRDIKYWRDTTLDEKVTTFGHGAYGAALKNTLTILRDRNLPAFHYDIHVPIRYNKTAFKRVMSIYDWEKKPGFVIKSLYCNTLLFGGENMVDNVDRGKGFDETALWLSTTNEVSKSTKNWLQQRFAERSRWEL